MAQVTSDDVERIREALFIDPPLSSPKSTKFWTLLVLAAVIASAGVLGDSTATVIGAMIVAPLMTPILGVAAAVVLSDREHVVRSLALVLLGGLTVVAIGFLMGWVASPFDDLTTNGQVSARINPRLLDLVAAVATGTVGAFALVRRDVSDTLPGVAIAISLVPPLAVVGILLQESRFGDAAGAALLFTTNFAAIVATGTLVLLRYRVRDAAKAAGLPVAPLTGRTLAVVLGGVVLVAVPLLLGSLSMARDARIQALATPVAQDWAAAADWRVTGVQAAGGHITVQALGSSRRADPAQLRRALDAAGLDAADLKVSLGLGDSRLCPAGSAQCLPPSAYGDG